MTDAGLKHLHLLSKLLDLNLSSTQVTDAGLEHLKSLVHLRELALSETKVNGKDVDALQKALPKVDIIR